MDEESQTRLRLEEDIATELNLLERNCKRSVDTYSKVLSKNKQINNLLRTVSTGTKRWSREFHSN